MKTATATVLAIYTAIGLGSAAPALGAPSDDGALRTRIVRFSDLDLSQAAGAHTLYSRIASAARVVCREQFSYALVRECRTRAIDAAVQSVGNPLVTSIHRSAVDSVEEVVLR